MNKKLSLTLRVWILYLICLSGSSCHEIHKSTIISEVNSSIENDDDLLVLVCSDYRNQLCITHKKFRHIAQCDPLNIYNRFIYYCCEMPFGEEFAIVLRNGQIVQLLYDKDTHNSKEYDYKQINKYLIANVALFENDVDQMKSIVLDTTRFYDQYLSSIISSVLFDSSKEVRHREQALQLFEKQPNKVFIPLYYELKEKTDKESVVIIPTELKETINLGIIQSGEIVECDISFKNNNVTDFLVFQTLVSCRCIEAECIFRTTSQNIGHLHIKYDSTDKSKGIDKGNITLITNATNKTVVIPITVDII